MGNILDFYKKGDLEIRKLLGGNYDSDGNSFNSRPARGQDVFGLYLLRDEIVKWGGAEVICDLKNNLYNIHNIELKNTNSIPKLLHLVWLTDQDRPQKAPNYYEILSNIQEKLEDFEISIWTNIDTNDFRDLHENIMDYKVNVKSIMDLETKYTGMQSLINSPNSLSQYIRKFINDNNFLYQIINNIDKSMGLKVDWAKYLIMESKGGLLMDWNFKVANNILDKMQKYDFIATHMEFGRIENSVFAARKSHPIFTDVLDMLEDSFFNQNFISFYISAKILGKTGIVEQLSMLPLAISFLKNFNKGDNKDALVEKNCKELLITEGYVNPRSKQQIESYKYKCFEIFQEDNPAFEDFWNLIKEHHDFRSELHSFIEFCIEENDFGVDNLSMSWA